MLRVTGRVYVEETGEELPGMHVKAVDKDLLFDDVLGTAITDAAGRYVITYDPKDFRELFETAPDLYVVVRDPASGRIVYSSERNLRAEARAAETIDVAVPRAALDHATGAPRPPYGPHSGKVQLKLAAANLPPEVALLFTEHRAEHRKQYAFTRPTRGAVEVELPSGEYTLQVQARGFETFRGLAEVDPRHPLVVDAQLASRQKVVRTFQQRLASYGIDPKSAAIGDLDVPPQTTHALNHATDEHKRGFAMLRADSIAKVKQWIGNDDARFGHDRAVYGALPDKKALARLRDPDLDITRLEPDETRAVVALAREFVEGNSRAVTAYAGILDKALKVTARDRIPLYFYRVVTIGPGATLEVGNGSAIFTCDQLRIHKTGRLRPVANVKIEIGTYTEFS